MNWSTIWELFKVNVLYSNPQNLVNIRNKQAKNPKKKIQAYKSILTQQLLALFFFGVTYSAILAIYDYSKFPGMFTTYILMFMALTLVSAFPPMFTVFYDSQDTKLYLPLPIKAGEILVAKILASLGMAIPYIIPALGLMIFLYLRLMNPVFAVLLAFVNFLVISLVTLSFSVIVVNRVGSILVKSPHKKLISTGLIGLSQLVAIVGLILINASNSSNIELSASGLPDFPIMPFISGFYDVALNPFSLGSLLNYWTWYLLLVVLIIVIFKMVIPGYYGQLLEIDSSSTVIKKRQTKQHSQRQLWIRHHLSTLKIPTLWTTALITSNLFIFMMIGPISAGNFKAHSISPAYFGIALTIGAAIGLMSTVFTSVGMSLERESFTFIKTLPMNFSQFLKEKFFILYLIQAGIPALIYASLGAVLGFHFTLIISLVIGIFLSSFILGQFDYRRDQKNLMLNWQNINQLLTRGNRQIWQMVIGIVFFLGFLALIVGAIILSFTIGALNTSLLLLFLTLIIASGLEIYIYNSFWKNL
ncbi:MULTISPECIES: ABC transporter permease [Streptococcus]|uniref:ABC transporter permease n=1 Tax=Streptococcus caledonicus TaxID=2614158 RepID=A0ABW0UG41_9STRE|nr:ABC transporter permease [Streptococcus sp. S784/96/1]